MGKRIFLLDDDDHFLVSFSQILRLLGLEVTTCSDSTVGVVLSTVSDYDLILSDIRMPGLNGVEAVRMIMRIQPLARVFILTAYATDLTSLEALEAGAKGILEKPIETSKILQLLKK